MQPSESARGKSGLAAFEVLQRSVAGFQADRGTESGAGDTPVHVWAACHGLAVLLIDTPMAVLPEPEKERLRRQHVHFVLNSLSEHRAGNEA